MSKKGKIQRVLGVVLLIVLIAPVIMLSIPQTRTEIVFHEIPTGMTSMIVPEYVEVTYIPLVNVFQNSSFGPGDIALIVGYVVLFALAIWLVVHSRKYRGTQ